MSQHIMLQVGKFALADTGVREQRYYASCVENKKHADLAIQKIQSYIHENLSKDNNISRLAELANMGERTFLRCFKSSTGQTPNKYLQEQRKEGLREYLEYY